MAAAALTEITVDRTDQFDEAWMLLNEYFEAVEVRIRDSQEAVTKYLAGDQSGVWIAKCNGEAAGCVVLRPLASGGAEVKRLYVRPHLRRLGIASRLMTALEEYAARIGTQTLYLDSKDDLHAAVKFYEREGHQRCERYNENSQATIFMRKTLPPLVQVRAFAPGDEEAFWSLNEAWISKLFKLEEKDLQTLREPQKYILSKGGRIYMALLRNQTVGCCALLKMQDGSYEVAKMGVLESERGKGVGRALLEKCIGEARALGISRLYLETNHTLQNAIHLYEAVGFVHLKAEEITPSPYVRADVFMEMIIG